MIYQKPDGEIEFGMSGCCCPPGQARTGQHTNSSTSWYRVRGWDRKAKPWQRAEPRLRSLRVLAEAAETCAEFEEAAPDA